MKEKARELERERERVEGKEREREVELDAGSSRAYAFNLTALIWRIKDPRTKSSRTLLFSLKNLARALSPISEVSLLFFQQLKDYIREQRTRRTTTRSGLKKPKY